MKRASIGECWRYRSPVDPQRPALRTCPSDWDIWANLRETLNARQGRRRLLPNLQIAAEIAIAFILLVGAGLLMRSFQAIRAVDLGFRTEHILSANFALPPSHYSNPQQYARFVADSVERVRAVPGVLSATATLGVPMRGSAGGDFEIFGRTTDTGEKLNAAIRPGDSQYLATLGISLSRGRSMDPNDVDGTPPVALINERLARLFFAGKDPLGQQIRIASKDKSLPWMTIVGIVRNTRHVGPLLDSTPEIHVPYMQFRSTGIQPKALIVRTEGEPERILPLLQRAVASVDKDQPLVSVRSMEQNLVDFIAPQRFDMTLMAIFATIGLVLASVGIFGVMSYRVHSGRRKLAFGWLWAPRTRMCCGWYWPKVCAPPDSELRSAGRERGC